MSIATDVGTRIIGELLGDPSAPRDLGMDLRIPHNQPGGLSQADT